jgi:hypothetical protein
MSALNKVSKKLGRSVVRNIKNQSDDVVWNSYNFKHFPPKNIDIKELILSTTK